MIHHTLRNANKLVYTNKKYYNYLKRSGSITGKISNKNIEDSLDAFKQRYDFLSQRYKNKVNDIKMHYMSALRNLYSRCVDKGLKKNIREIFIKTYKNAKVRNKKDIAFYFMPQFYSMVFRYKLSKASKT